MVKQRDTPDERLRSESAKSIEERLTDLARASAETLASEHLRAREQDAVSSISRLFFQDVSLPVFLQESCEQVARGIGLEHCEISQLVEDEDRLSLIAGVGWTEDVVGIASVPAGTNSQPGYALSVNGPVAVVDYREEQRFAPSKHLVNHHVRSGISAVIRGRSRTWGVLSAYSAAPRSFSAEDLAFMGAAANTLAMAISRKEDEDTVQESAARMRAILETAVDGIVTIDSSGNIESINSVALQMFGYELDEVRGQNVRLLMPPPFRAEHDSYIESYLETGEAKIIGIGREVVGRRKDGSDFPVDLSVSEVRFDGSILFTGLLRDLSDRKEAEARVRRSEGRARAAEQLASIGMLSAGLAHEVGTPMNVILGYAQMIERSTSDPKIRERAQIIHEQVRRVSHLIETLLNLARPHEARRCAMDVSDIVDRSLKFLKDKFDNQKIDVEWERDGVHTVFGEQERIEQLLLNLFVNASDAMSKGGTLRVRVEQENGEISLRIADSGTGMTKEVREHVFDPFFTTKERGRGSGLGLVVCKGIVSDHGGAIEVASEPGQGTEFTITLPEHREESGLGQ